MSDVNGGKPFGGDFGFELHETNHEPSRWQIRHEVRGWHHKTFATEAEAIAWCEGQLSKAVPHAD